MTKPIYRRQTETENIMGDRIVLCYFVQERTEMIETEKTVRYGVGIDMYTQLPGQRTAKERKVVEGVFRIRTDAEKFIDVLCEGYVTPTTLEDIINDTVAERCAM